MAVAAAWGVAGAGKRRKKAAIRLSGFQLFHAQKGPDRFFLKDLNFIKSMACLLVKSKRALAVPLSRVIGAIKGKKICCPPPSRVVAYVCRDRGWVSGPVPELDGGAFAATA